MVDKKPEEVNQLLESIDKQLLLKLLDSLIVEQNINLTGKDKIQEG